MDIGLIITLGGLTLLGFCVLLAQDRQRRAHRARMSRALPHQPETLPVASPKRRARTQGDDALSNGLSTLDRKLARAGLSIGATEALAQAGLAALALFAALVLVFGVGPLIAIPASVATATALGTLIIRIAHTRRLAAFTEGLPEALDVLARGLRAGRPVADSLGIVVENAAEPVRGEMTICHGQLRMGSALQDVFTDLATRIPTPEARFFSVATSLQAETGGNLIETLENLAIQLRERRKLKKKGRALSSEARASAMILAALPFGVGSVIYVLNAGYMEPLFTDPRGRWLLASGLSGIALGVVMMVRMGKLDV